MSESVRIPWGKFQSVIYNNFGDWYWETNKEELSKYTDENERIIFTDDAIPHDDVLLLIFSSIPSNKELTRPKDTDSIRICLYSKEAGEIISKPKRTYRQEGWPSNLQENIETVVDEWNSRIADDCRDCGKGWESLKKGPYGWYTECTNCGQTYSADN